MAKDLRSFLAMSDPSPSQRRIASSLLILVLASAALAVIGGSHDLLLSWKFGTPFDNSTFYYLYSDETHKMAEVNETIRGNALVGNPFLREEAFAPATNSPGAPGLVGQLLRFSGISLAASTWLFDLLMPALTFLVVCWGFRRLFPETPFPLIAAVAFLFVLTFLMQPSQQRGLLRYMQAQATTPLFMGLILASFLVDVGRISPKEFGILLILNGCSLWLDPWSALRLMALQSMFLLYQLVVKEWDRAVSFTLLALSIVVGGGPELLRIVSIGRAPGFKLLTERMGTIATILPDYPVFLIWLAVFFGLSFVAFRLRLLRWTHSVVRGGLFMMFFLVALYFQNMVTGFRLYFQGTQVANMAMVPAGLIASAALIGTYARWPRARLTLTVILILSSVANHMVTQLQPMEWKRPPDNIDSIYGLSSMRVQKIYRPAADWLKAHTPETAVVMVDPMSGDIVRLAAQRYVYYAGSAVHASLNQDGLRRRYYPFFWMKGGRRSETARDDTWRMHEYVRHYESRDYAIVYCSAGTLLPHQIRTNAVLERYGLRPFFNVEPARVKFQANIDALYDGYDSFVQGRSVSGLKDLLTQQCDYLVWGPQERFFYSGYDPFKDVTMEQVFATPAKELAIFRFR